MSRPPVAYTRFLEGLLGAIPELTQNKPELGLVLGRARIESPRSSGYTAVIPNPLVADAELRWAFRNQDRTTQDRSQKSFNVEFMPSDCRLNLPTVEAAWRASGLVGDAGEDGRGFYFQLVWGRHGHQDVLVRDQHVADRLRRWAVDAAEVAISLVSSQRRPVS